MAKSAKTIRVHEFAKEKGKTSKEILALVVELKLDIKASASAGLTDDMVDALEGKLNVKKTRAPLKLALAVGPAKAAPKPKKKPKPEPEPVEETAEEAPAAEEEPKPAKLVKTAAQVKREAKIRKRKEREAEKKRLAAIAKEEEAERALKKAAKKKAKKAEKAEKAAEAAAAAPEEEKEPERRGATIISRPEPVKPEPEVKAKPKPKAKAKPKAKRKKKGAAPAAAQTTEEKTEGDHVERPVYRMLDSVGAGNRPAKAAPATPPDLNIKHGARPRPGRPRRRKSPAARDRDRSRQNRRRRRDESRRPVAKPEIPTEFEVSAPISIRDFSKASGIKAQSIIIKLLNEGMVSNINTIIDKDTVDYLAVEFERTVTFKEEANVEDKFLEVFNQVEDKEEDMVKRNPIVTFLGHVDHGKTSLLDSIREAVVVTTESGGITQHTSAYIYAKDKKNITFIDTPGHAVFTEMRIRGAQVTDIVVLVVAADDGVMPQTREAYDHAVAAEVPIIVAMNKIDLPGADINRLMGQLAEMGLTSEEWGGSTQCAPVSAINGEGVDGLLEMIMLEAEILDLNANAKRDAQAIVLETNLSDSRGIEATVVVKNGTLKKGDDFLCGRTYGRVRHMWDPNEKSINDAGPSTPVVLTGFTDMPVMGDYLYVTEDQQQAKAIAEKRSQASTAAHIDKPHISMANLLETLTAKGLQELNIIIKADTKGSVEAIMKGLGELGNKEVAMKVIHSGVGGINESDVMLADASDAIIIGFHVAPEVRVDVLADTKGVEIRRYHVIYEIFKEMEDALSGMLAPAQVEETLGRVEVRQIFTASALGTIAGCYVTSGLVRKTAQIRVLRNNIEIFDGLIGSLKRIKDDAAEVKENFECGIKITGFDDIKEGDEFEIYQVNEVERTLSSITD